MSCCKQTQNGPAGQAAEAAEGEENMLYPAMSELIKNINNRYLLVNVVARRSRQIAAEADTMGILLEGKPVSMAISEVAKGKIKVNIDERDKIINQ